MTSDESNEIMFALIGIGVVAVLLGVAAWLAWRLVRFYRRAPGSKRMLVILATLAFFHLLGLVSFFTVPFAMETPRNLLLEVFEVEFWVFPAAFISIWGLISVLVILRHRVLHYAGEERTLRLVGSGVCAVLLAMAVGTMRLVPDAMQVFAAFGADLPAPTLFFLNAGWSLLLLPACALVAVAISCTAADASGKPALFASGGLVSLLVIANAALFGALGSAYLPFFTMCGSPEMASGFTRLHAAAALGRETSVRRHIAAGAPVGARDLSGATPLQVAVAGGHASIATALLESSADVNATTGYGQTPMHAAAALGRTDIAELLLARGARIDAKDRRAGQPLHRAAYRGHLAMVILLLDRGADVNAEDDQGATPLDQAVDGKQTLVAELVAQRGGVRSTKESRLRAAGRAKTQATAQVPFGSCGV